jgi:hypothetical protein
VSQIQGEISVRPVVWYELALSQQALPDFALVHASIAACARRLTSPLSIKFVA